MRTLRRKVRAKAKVYPDFVDVRAALRARTFADYDRVVTAPLHGFTDERDYWRRSSSGPFLARIRRPVLLINALDDPFIPVASLPAAAALPPGIETDFTAHGGHAGFLEGVVPWRPRSWAEARAVGFLDALLAGGGRR
jgi:predicted alpha/beta-fold hydrolase